MMQTQDTYQYFAWQSQTIWIIWDSLALTAIDHWQYIQCIYMQYNYSVILPYTVIVVNKKVHIWSKYSISHSKAILFWPYVNFFVHETIKWLWKKTKKFTYGPDIYNVWICELFLFTAYTWYHSVYIPYNVTIKQCVGTLLLLCSILCGIFLYVKSWVTWYLSWGYDPSCYYCYPLLV